MWCVMGVSSTMATLALCPLIDTLSHSLKFKGIVHPKMKCWKCIQNPKWLFLHQNRFGEIEHFFICSPMGPLQWMGAIRMRVQTAVKNVTIIHMTLIRQFTSCEVRSYVFVRNNLFCFTLNHWFWPKYKPIIHNDASSSEKIHSLLSSHIKILQHICLLNCFELGNNAWLVIISLLN